MAHAERTHSRLGASSAKRWMTCPGSVRELANVPNTSSAAAAEGTRAHEWAEHLLKSRQTSALPCIGVTLPGHNAPMTKDMAEAVSVYLEHVDALAGVPGAELYVEQRLRLTDIDAELYGTNDACVYLPATRHLHVIDYKHGAGVFVDVVGNPQLLYYAYGALLNHNESGVDTVTLHVVQPRCGSGDGVRSFDNDPMDLFCWAATLADAVRATRAPDAPLVPGDHCRETFCSFAPQCPALRSAALAAAADDFAPVADPTTFGAEELGTRLREARLLSAYLNALQDHAESEAKAGRMPSGWKYVEGRGKRAWKPEFTAEQIASEIAKVSNAVDPWKRELISVPGAETALGKKVFAALEKRLVEKKPGAPQLVPQEDKRAAWTESASDFEPVTAT